MAPLISDEPMDNWETASALVRVDHQMVSTVLDFSAQQASDL